MCKIDYGGEGCRFFVHKFSNFTPPPQKDNINPLAIFEGVTIKGAVLTISPGLTGNYELGREAGLYDKPVGNQYA